MNIYHTHHIIPKHMGGTDDPSNLIRLTVEEHAEAHRILYEKHGHEYDYVAWLGLSGRISKQDASRMAEIENGKRAHKNKTGIHGLSEEESFSNRSKGGKKGGKVGGIVATSLDKKKKIGMFGISTCPHCDKTGSTVIMHRWHFNKCKSATGSVSGSVAHP